MIPCSLFLNSLDPQALDLLASPKAVVARLRQQVKYLPGNSTTSANKSRQQSLVSGYKVEVQDVGAAVWWVPASDAPTGDQGRRLEGEIHLSKGLQPSTAFTAFKVEVEALGCSFTLIGNS